MLPWLYNGRNHTFFFASYKAYRNKSAAARERPPSRRPPCTTATSPDGATPTAILFRSTTRRPPRESEWDRVSDPFPGNMIPPWFSHSRVGPPAGDDAARPAGCPNNSCTPRAMPSTRTRGTSSASSSITTSRARIGWDFSSTGASARDSAEQRACGGLPVPEHFRDEDSHTYVYRLNWDRVIKPTLLNRVTFGHNNWWQFRPR